MGVPGLQSFIEEELPHVLESVDISLCAKEFAQRKKCVPVLLINGASIFRMFYAKYPPSASYLCLNDTFGLHLQRLIKVYSDSNIKSIVYFKGTLGDTAYFTKRRDDAMKLPGVLRMLESDRPEEGYEDLAWRCGIDVELLKYFLRLSKCQIKQFEGLADVEVMKLISQYECFGILAQDTDFIIMEGVENYFSIQHLDESMLRTKCYRRNLFAKCLRIDERYLPIFATLCANQYIPQQELRQFHSFLLQSRPDINKTELEKNKLIPLRFLLPKVAQWVKQNVRHFENCGNTPRIVGELINLPHIEKKISLSLASYSSRYESPQLQVENQCLDENWSEIIRTASFRHKENAIHLGVWYILSQKKYFIKNNYLVVCDSEYPCWVASLEDLLRRISGVLFKEYPKELGTATVQLFCYKKDSDYLPSDLNPIFPSEHLGLLHLWEDSPLNDKLSLICWVVSDKLNPSSVLCLPEDVRIASLALFYLINEKKLDFEPWQVNALVGQLVCLSEGIDLSDWELSPRNRCEIYISTMYMTTWNLIAMADDACGNPLQIKSRTVIFDGQIFNKMFNAMREGCTVDGVSDSLLHKTVLEFVGI